MVRLDGLYRVYQQNVSNLFDGEALSQSTNKHGNFSNICVLFAEYLVPF